MTATDTELRRDVEQELEWEPAADERNLGVNVARGVVTLSGDVNSYLDKWNAERAVERVRGVRGIANEIRVLPVGERSDSEIATAALNVLRWDALVPEGIAVRVEDGWVTLVGDVEWDYQRRAAEHAVRRVLGVLGVTNQISLKPQVSAHDLKHRIEHSPARQAILDSDAITVEADGGDVTLRGAVGTWAERRAAEYAAWAAPGVQHVHNDLTVDPWI